LDNKIDGAILSLVDIDALKQLVGSAQLARAEAERANGAKDLFLAVLGHELRTPLTTLLLRAQMLRRGAVSDSVKLAQVGETIERATRIQMQLVDDLLDVSKIVAGKLKVKLRAVDLSAVVRAALDEVSGAAQAKSILMDVRLDESIGAVAGDCIRLQQVVVNLLTNAIKFTPVAGQIVVTLEAAGGSARIRVSDSGAGIEPEFLPQVFNRFSQQDTSSTRTHGGLGLGLAIVRHLVEQHGGEVEAQSPGVGQGATFTVTIPLMKARQALTHDGEILVSAGRKDLQSSSDRDRLKALSVLVIDDDLATRETVAEMLEGMGAEVRKAGSSAEAMTAVREQRPKVLLCDIAMPGEDGYMFIRKLRALGREVGGETPALALTALAAEGDPQRSLDAGFQMHLTKPVDITRLSEAVIALAQAIPAKAGETITDGWGHSD
jgi:two-component system CheB/CheR fusion protein